MEFEPGTVVYAKLKGFPWWPARVENEEQVPDDVAEKKPRGQNISVRFFGTRNYGWIGNKDIKTFDKKEAEDKLQELKDTKRDQLLADSIREAFDPSTLDEEEEETSRKKPKTIFTSRRTIIVSRKPKAKSTSSISAKSSKAKITNNKKGPQIKSRKSLSKVKDNVRKKNNVVSSSKSRNTAKKSNEAEETGTHGRGKNGNKTSAGGDKDNGPEKKTNKRSRADVAEDNVKNASGSDDVNGKSKRRNNVNNSVAASGESSSLRRSTRLNGKSDADEEITDKKIINKGNKMTNKRKRGDRSTESVIIANGEQSVNGKNDKNGEGNDSGEKKVTFEENGVEKDAAAEVSNTQKNESL